jgi:hypothetical protein
MSKLVKKNPSVIYDKYKLVSVVLEKGSIVIKYTYGAYIKPLGKGEAQNQKNSFPSLFSSTPFFLLFHNNSASLSLARLKPSSSSYFHQSSSKSTCKWTFFFFTPFKP